MKWKMDKAIHVAVKEKIQSSKSSEDGDMDLSDCTIKMTHFKQALSLVTPSVTKQVTPNALLTLSVFNPL